MKKKYTKYFSLALPIATLISCNDLSVNLNNKVIYTPTLLFKEFTMADEHLKSCLEQTIADKHISKASELTQLNCSHAGIKSLSGIEMFSELTELNLNENNLNDIHELETLSKLQVVMLRKNNLTSAEPFLKLLHLKEVDLAENEQLKCREVTQIEHNFSKNELKLIRPTHCKQ
jgi:Leucine-rich repeat (LRR) protein